MPELKCEKCGGETNTAACEYEWKNHKIVAVKCYARVENNKWVKGCSEPEQNDMYARNFINSLIVEGGE